MILEDINSTGITQDHQSKRGKKNTSTTNYFDVREENAVVLFLNAETIEERNKIYNEFLKKPIEKMVSSIIRRYKLYRKDMSFDEILNDTHSFLITKSDKFVPDKNKKAYSYFGTICKNYLMGQIIKDQKEINRKVSYEDISSNLENRPDMVYYIENDAVESDKIISDYIDMLKEFIKNSNLNENETRLGEALLQLFETYDQIFVAHDNKKFNKNLVLLSLREMTNLSTKEIRLSMKRYKKLYFDFVKKIDLR
jgi:predicted SprT family Zn-dependent metalloprotease